MDKLTRKELKSDKFALEVQHSVEYVSVHRQQLIRWGVPAAALVVIIAGVLWYRSYQHNARQEALHSAMLVQNSIVGQAPNEYAVTFPTADARKAAVRKTWGELIAKYPGSEEAAIGEFFLGTTAADDGNLAEAEKHFKASIDAGNDVYASQAKLALAEVYASEGKVNDGAKLIQSIIDHPTVLVSKDAATLALAELIGKSDPKRAHQLVDPLRTSTRGAVSKAAITLEGSLPPQ